jgi:type IV secretion system protein TrbL
VSVNRRFAIGKRWMWRAGVYACASVVFAMAVQAASPASPPSSILQAYRAQRTTWFANVWPATHVLFGLLATIDFAWSAAVMLLERQDFQSWAAAMVRKMMTIGCFYALLIYGRLWIPAITDSFETLGQHASGGGPLAPSDIFARGLTLAGALIDSASNMGILDNIGTALSLVVAAVLTLLAFCGITIQFVVAMVESYILVAAGFVFLGFGGSRWSAPYVERYIGLAISIGVKIMLLYLLIGTGLNLSVGWMSDAENIANASKPATEAFSIMGGSLIFLALCWQAPKLVAGVMGGSPALTGGDLLSTGATVAAGGLAVGAAAFTGGASLAAAGGSAGKGIMTVAQAAGAAGGPASGAGMGSAFSAAGHGAAVFKPAASAGAYAGSAGSAASSAPKPPTPAPGGSSGSGAAASAPTNTDQVPPPKTSAQNGSAPQKSSPSVLAKGAAKLQNARNSVQNLHRQIPSDSAPHAGAPRMNIEHHE